MEKYHKILTVYERDPETKYRTLIEGKFACPEFEYLKNNIWTFTEKVDGTNIRVVWEDGNLKYKGRTDDSQIPTFLLERLDEIFRDKISKVFEINDSKICLYGEGYGKKIQKRGELYKPDGIDFVLFDIRIGEWFLKREDVESLAKEFSIAVVPSLGKGTLFDMVNIVKKGFNSAWGNFCIEGIVAKPEIELYSRDKKRIITKIKVKDFNK